VTLVPVAPPEEQAIACPRCATPLGPEQEWCLTCGAAARTRLVPTPNWRAPLVVLAIVALLAGAALAVAFAALTRDSPTAAPTTTAPAPAAATQPPAPTTAPAQPAPGATATTAPPAAGQTTGATPAPQGQTSTTTPPPGAGTATTPSTSQPLAPGQGQTTTAPGG
jgi:hypothetical protein